ncbi:phage protein [Streptococcus pneumoniae]|nr:phage protein [Streptococcus pneumoniae]VSR37921.1 phage protein [Streptococcus pneumoniae]
MAINGYNLSTKPYLRISGSNVETVVEIQLSEGNRYSTNQRSFPGDRTNESEDVLIQAVLDVLKSELDPSSAIVQAQNKLEQAEQQIAHNKSEQDRLAQVIKQTEENAKVNQKVIHVLVLNSVMSKNIEYGTTYKELIELIPLAEVGKTYLPHDLITIEDPEHVEVNGEGKRILVQLNKEFTYNGEPVSAFVTNGSLEQNGTGVAWKFEGKE